MKLDDSDPFGLSRDGSDKLRALKWCELQGSLLSRNPTCQGVFRHSGEDCHQKSFVGAKSRELWRQMPRGIYQQNLGALKFAGPLMKTKVALRQNHTVNSHILISISNTVLYVSKLEWLRDRKDFPFKAT